VATALFRLAECYRKTGKREEAGVAYRRVIREFSDRATLVESSRLQLATAYGVTDRRPGEATTRTSAASAAASGQHTPVVIAGSDTVGVEALNGNSPTCAESRGRTDTPAELQKREAQAAGSWSCASRSSSSNANAREAESREARALTSGSSRASRTRSRSSSSGSRGRGPREAGSRVVRQFGTAAEAARILSPATTRGAQARPRRQP